MLNCRSVSYICTWVHRSNLNAFTKAPSRGRTISAWCRCLTMTKLWRAPSIRIYCKLVQAQHDTGVRPDKSLVSSHAP